MKQLTVLCVLILFVILFIGLNQTALNPSIFSGPWYSSDDQNLYLFEEGLIYCSKHPVHISDESFISGAYAIGKKSVILFASGVEGLEQEKMLYLIHKDNGSFLCENENGSGKVYFIRYQE